jgi:hypothetical protein
MENHVNNFITAELGSSTMRQIDGNVEGVENAAAKVERANVSHYS